MIIEKTPSKYNVGCGIGYGIDIPDLEFKLNLIIDKERSKWPKPVDQRTQEEIDSGVPAPEVDREIHEGDTFLFDGTIFAIDHDRLVQVISETGPLAFQRVFDSYIKPEIEFLCFDDDNNDYSWDDPRELPEGLTEYTPPYEWMKIWHENFVLDRNLRENYVIKVTITDSFLGFSRDIYLTEWKAYYSQEDFDELEFEYKLKTIMCWFYSEIGRVTK